jgi:hypothetical protein
VATLTDFFGFCFNNKLEAHDGSLCLGPDGSRPTASPATSAGPARFPSGGR